MRKLTVLIMILASCAIGVRAFGQEQDKTEGNADGPASELGESPQKDVPEATEPEAEGKREKKEPKIQHAVRSIILRRITELGTSEFPDRLVEIGDLTVEVKDGRVFVNGREVGEAVDTVARSITVKDGKVCVDGKEVFELPESLKLPPLPDAIVPIPVPGELRRRIVRIIPGEWKEKVEEHLKRNGRWEPVLPPDREEPGGLGEARESLLKQLRAIRARIDRLIRDVERLSRESGEKFPALRRIRKRLRVLPGELKLRVFPKPLREQDGKNAQEEKDRKNSSLRDGILRRVEDMLRRRLEHRQDSGSKSEEK